MEFNCLHCGEELDWQAELVGEVLPCPACGTELTVPASDQDVGIIEETYDADNKVDGTVSIAAFARERGLDGGDVQLNTDLAPAFDEDEDQKYHIGKKIAQGGMGAILAAQDLNIRRPVAMKVMLHPERVSDQQMARFIEEAQITGQLEHPGIVPVHELGIDKQNRPFYSMKLLGGQTLGGLLAKLKQGDPDTVRDWPLSKLITAFVRVCEAMAYAHSRQVIHRDLKPENIIIGDFGEVQVLDWGLAKILGRPERESDDAPPSSHAAVESVRTDETSQHLRSLDGTVAGTPQYMSPEQAAGKVDKLDHRTDIYALGAILYELLSFERVIDSGTVQSILHKVLRGDLVPLAERPTKGLPHLPSGQVPPALAAIATKALARRPGQRYADTAALITDIESYQNGFATAAEDAGPIRQLALFLRRNKVFAIATGLVLAAVLIGTSVSWVQRNRAVQALDDKVASENARKADQLASAPAIYSLATQAATEGRFDESLRLARVAQNFDPNDDHPLALIAGIACLQTNVAEALQTLEGRESMVPLWTHIKTWKEHQFGGQPREDLADYFASEYELSQIAFRMQSDENALATHQVEIEKHWPGFGYLLTKTDRRLQFIARNLGPEKAKELHDLIKKTQLEPLNGIPLAVLRISGPPGSAVHDLSALEPNKTLEFFEISQYPVGPLKNIDALANKKLTEVRLYSTQITDLSPLAGQPIEIFRSLGNGVSSLEPLRGAPLKEFRLSNREVKTLEPLRGAPLNRVGLSGVGALDLSILPDRLDYLGLDSGTAELDLATLKNLRIAEVSLSSPEVILLSQDWLADCQPRILRSDSGLERLPSPWFLDCEFVETFDCIPTKVCFETKAFEAAIEAADWATARKEATAIRRKGEAILGFAAHPAILAQTENTVDVYEGKLFGPRDANLYERDGHHYWFVPAYADWKTAQAWAKKCGGQLAQLETREEFDWALGLLGLASAKRPRQLIGAWRPQKEAEFEWADGTPIGDVKWGYSARDSSVVALDYVGLVRHPPDLRERFLIEWDGPPPKNLGKPNGLE